MFGLKPREERIITYKSGNFFDLVCEFLVEEMKVKHKVHQIESFPGGSLYVIFKNIKHENCVINKNHIKVYKLKRIIRRLNE